MTDATEQAVGSVPVSVEHVLQMRPPKIGMPDDPCDIGTALRLHFGCSGGHELGLADGFEMIRSILAIGRTALHEHSLDNIVPAGQVSEEFRHIVVHVRLGPEMVVRIDDLAIRIDNVFLNLRQPVAIIEHHLRFLLFLGGV